MLASAGRGGEESKRLVIEAPWLVNGGHSASLMHRCVTFGLLCPSIVAKCWQTEELLLRSAAAEAVEVGADVQGVQYNVRQVIRAVHSPLRF
eukprot:SAG25_NODE_1373_length_3177_cov_2.176088_6_plen_92_part_00